MAVGTARFERESFFVGVGPLTTERMSRIPGQISAYMRSERGREFAYRRPGPWQPWEPVPPEEFDAALERSVRTLEVEPELTELYALFHETDHRDLAVSFVLTPSFFYLAFAHYFLDGSAGFRHTTALLSDELGEVEYLADPVQLALDHLGMDAGPAAQQARAAHHTALAEALGSSASAPLPAEHPPAQLAHVVLDKEQLRAARARISAGERPGSSRQLQATAVVGRMIARAAAAALDDGLDMVVLMPVDLRRYLPPRAGTAGGNFSSHQVIGRLRSSEWSATEFTERIFPMLERGEPLATSIALDAAHAHRGRAKSGSRIRRIAGRGRRALGRATHAAKRVLGAGRRASVTTRSESAPRGALELSINILMTGLGTSASDFVPGEVPKVVALPIMRSYPVTGVHVSATISRSGSLTITIASHGGVIPIQRFATAVRAELS